MRTSKKFTSTVILCILTQVLPTSSAQHLIGQLCTNNTQCVNASVCLNNATDSSARICQCEDDSYAQDNRTCALKHLIGQPCTDNSQCVNASVCRNNASDSSTTTCQCEDDSYAQDDRTCALKSLFGQPCSTSMPCMETLTCNSSKVCGCKDSEFLNSNSQQCQNRSLFGQPCSTSMPCMETLTCNSSKVCGCKDSEFLNSSSQQCQNKRNYSESCSGTSLEECWETSTVCKDNNKTSASKMCLCDQSTYRTDNNTCISRDYLIVGSISHTSQTTQVSLHWEDRSQRGNVSYKITWTSSGKSISSISASRTGGNVTNLEPGTQYIFTVIGSLPSDDYYEKTEMQSSQYTAWTYPAKPGSVVQVLHISEAPNVIYNITFGKSNGTVSYYKMVTWVEGNITSKEENKSSGPTETITFYGLKPGQWYNYNITAYNGNGSSSDIVSGSFRTKANAPGPVQQLTVTALDYNASVSWVTPAASNGNITGYLVQVKELNGSCLYMKWITCRDCPQQNISSYENFSREGCDVENGTSYTSAELQDRNQRFVLELPKLKAYHNYTVEVTAINEADTGSKVPCSFTTEAAAANTVTNVKLSSSRNSNDLVSLNISWTSGEFTGPTTYYITVQESHGLESKEDPETYSVEGYDNKTYVVPNVLAFWSYTVYIIAGTDKGNSTRSPEKKVQTVPSRPGTVTDLTVEQDKTIAKKLNISFLCPEERRRNGTITTFIVKQTLLGPNNSSESNLTQEGDLCKDRFININVWRDIVVQQNYTFQIKTFNQEYAGDYGDTFSLYIEPKVPRLGESMEELITKSKNNGDEKTKISVDLCAPCLTDKSQGIVRNVGLIVCVVGDQKCPQSGRKKRSTVSFDSFKNWNTAKQQSFKIRYRTTPDNWNQTLEGQNKQYSYVIGDNTSCDATSYCNGPLPSGSKVYISVVVCTDAGCDVYDESEVFMTASEPETNVGAIVGGVLCGLALILCICITLWCFWRKHNTKTKSNNPNVNLKAEDGDSFGQVNTSPRHFSQPKDENSHIYSEISDYDYISNQNLKNITSSRPTNIELQDVRSHDSYSRTRPAAGDQLLYPYENSITARYKEDNIHYENYL